ncbi:MULTISPECIES: phosphoribosylanthranilate isomerase [unclassified Marinobacter]|uniref:phosphoribosylanthranilate isomerase n=1 Tax=unclassified Marinobacter TaxID=83889 RepID=UPI0026E22D1A|nr:MULTISPECIES: phosphoribosylanthranilate isomerase [unclassified Marinobacter]MDO6442450.1 phosphoribosylanthranilate isomerase [Marinobacter sp. 2_MG-2023]MDO6824506.1 phosphoribosylanthranilate isomerase [Marinobacter sp. 1_MG-2023]
MNTRVKICGLTRVQDVKAAVESGADALGFVFYEPSSRAVTVADAEVLVRQVPAFVSVVGLFVNPSAEQVREVLDRIPLDLLQFHGDETADFCSQFGRRWIKAVRVQSAEQIEQAFTEYQSSAGLLVDAWDPDHYGGTGRSFNWDLVPLERPLPLILAGGLSSDNVFKAVEQVKPWAVDVSGGVEKSKGIKDIEKISDFIKEVHRVCKID